MIARTMQSLAAATGGRQVGADCSFGTVSTDSRTLPAGALFVALRGPNFDGHTFVTAARERGAAGLLVDHELPVDLPQVVVEDVLEALTRYAAAWRRQFDLPLVGITGSNGKTTTKEILSAILKRRGPCLVTRGNLNNHIGMPLMLLELERTHRTAVIEMGANHRGEIAHLAATAAPTVGVVTNAGAAHLEGFGSLDGVALGKGEMFSALAGRGTAVINADDKYAPLWHSLAGKAPVITFGIEARADVSARDIEEQAQPIGFASRFELITPMGQRQVRLQLGGRHNVHNALAATAAACATGASLDDIEAGLAAVRPVAGRLQLQAALQGATLIDDTYNANPTSVKAGLDAFKAVSGRRWLVLGNMGELGADTDALHAEVGAYARASGIERLYAVGASAKHAAEAFGDAATWFGDIESLIAAVRADLAPGVAVLVKGSRSNRLERVARALTVEPPEGDAHAH